MASYFSWLGNPSFQNWFFLILIGGPVLYFTMNFLSWREGITEEKIGFKYNSRENLSTVSGYFYQARLRYIHGRYTYRDWIDLTFAVENADEAKIAILAEEIKSRFEAWEPQASARPGLLKFSSANFAGSSSFSNLIFRRSEREKIACRADVLEFANWIAERMQLQGIRAIPDPQWKTPGVLERIFSAWTF